MTPFRRRLFDMALRLGRKRYRGPAAACRWSRRILDRAVRSPGAAQGGAALRRPAQGLRLRRRAAQLRDRPVLHARSACRILQGYGQTESAPVASVNRPVKVKLHTVGPPLRDTEVRIAEDGEILIRGELVMSGYWRDPECDRDGAARRLAAYRRYRPARRRRLPADHRPQEGHHRAVRRRQCRAGADRGLPAAAAGDRPGHGRRRQASRIWSRCWCPMPTSPVAGRGRTRRPARWRIG